MTELPSAKAAPRTAVAAARLAPQVAALFPAGVVAVELAGEANPALLHPEERRVVARVAARRLKDYAAGRECARLALRHLGIEDFALLPASDRQPVWPEGITGSITHTQGYCAVAAARTTQVRGLGIDAEVAQAVHEELWPRICRPEELEWLAGQSAEQRGCLAALLFAAKEAFYKSQYPLTGEWLGFEEVRVELTAEGQLQVKPLRPIRLQRHAQLPVQGAYRFHEGWVIAAVTLT